MTPAARLQAALELIEEVEADARPADAVVSAWFRSRRDLNDRDHGELSDLLYAVLRGHARLNWHLAKQRREPTARNRLLAWLALGEGKTRDQIQRLFTGGRFAPAALTDGEGVLLARLQGGTLEHPEMPDGVLGECPDWALGPMQSRFGEAFTREMAAMLRPPPLDLRVNPLKGTRESVLEALRRIGFEAQACRMAPHGIRLPRRLSLARLPMLKTGAVEIQDEGSQLVALLVGARPGERVVDFCAGAGGKTLAMACDMANKGAVIACDISEARLKRAAGRFRGAGLHNIQTRVLTSERDKWVKRHKGGFDRVLVDAPCSGTGTWRRNPDARWRAQDAGLEALAALQREILDSAARLVKPGGRLVYATCSLLAEENEAQVEAFLAAHPEFRLVPLGEAAPQITGSAHPDYLSLTPARHGTDGFFAAAMTRDAPVTA
ncbi:MAG: methyltransferase domain-containing protein [Phenylobacterium sp.]|uniref:RsmB/NOP family class I SAM-dependent RNA methyltransferase n=1 Tax=Phenylobacterium sp. TaxID=1871053 RepID=UPI0025D5EADF|nr:RsmB/NOP family class I SAM-dependent RNA methyltransferase [Phenylobacterium sp.]MBI1199042.1 methyltransferase domain-containing protein [Phenylobacterium sp.]